MEEHGIHMDEVLDRYDAVNAKLGEDMSPEEMEKTLDEQSRLQDRIDATKINCGDIGIAVKLKESGTGDTISTKNNQIVARVAPRYAFHVGDVANLHPDLAKIHFFDLETEKAIF